MGYNVIFTLADYKAQYHILLENFLSQYIDYEEIDFVKFELDNYKMYLLNTWYDYDPNKPDEYFDPKENLFHKKNVIYPVIDEISAKAKELNPADQSDGYDLLAFSFKKIIAFLKKRKEVIQTEVNTNSVKLDFISFLALQLKTIYSNLKKETSNKYLIYNYQVCEKEIELLDTNALHKYLTETEIKNPFFLTELTWFCNAIIELYNTNIHVIPNKELVETLHWERKDGAFGYTALDFHAMDIRNFTIQNFNTSYGQKEFMNNYTHKNYSLWDIANRCSLMISYLTASNEQVKTEFLKFTKNESVKDDVKHDNIFSNNGFKMFEYILKNSVTSERGRKSDIIFFYWAMHDNTPQYIHQSFERFKTWFDETYNEDIGQSKTFLQVKNPDRLKGYSAALDWFKEQK